MVAGVAVSLVFAQSRLVEASLFPYAILLQVTPIVAIAPLIIIWVKDTRIALVLCAVGRRDISDHLQYDAWPAQRRPRLARSVPDAPRHALASADAPADPERAPLFLRGIARCQRAGADRRRRRRVRGRHRRARRRSRLPDPARRHPTQHSAAFRGAVPDHDGRRRPLPRHRCACARRRSHAGTRASWRLASSGFTPAR